MTPFAKAKDGSEIKNPFKDKRVRQAMTKAINRDAIVARVMEGVAVPAGQFLPDGYFGVSTKLKPVAYDPEGAKKLLAEAGFANGFKLTLHTPNGRYTNDVKIAEAVAQMLTRVGIETALEALQPAVFFTRASQGGPNNVPEFSFILVGWATPHGREFGLAGAAGQYLRPGQGNGHDQPRPLLQSGGGQAVGRGAQDQRRRQAGRAAGARRPRSPSRTWPSSPRTTRSTPGRRARGCTTRRARTSTRWQRMRRSSDVIPGLVPVSS